MDHLVINSVSVRGRLGPLTVWVSNNEDSIIPSAASASASSRRSSRRHRSSSSSSSMSINNRITVERNPENNRNQYSIDLHPSAWTKLYEKTHCPSQREYQELPLDQPICLKPGETRVVYIHSTLPGDEAIVYDNSNYGTTIKRFEDDKLAIMTGRAHVSSQAFGQDPIWGWGNAWRDRREFVGRLAYGTVYKLWNPEMHLKFGECFQDGARALLMCQRRWESPWSILPDECIYYILNMCRWDWFNDCSDSMKVRKRAEKSKAKHLAMLQDQKELQVLVCGSAKAAIAPAKAPPANEEDAKPSATEHVCMRVTRSQSRAVRGHHNVENTVGTDDDGDYEFEVDDTDDLEGDDDDEMDEDNEDEEEDAADSDNWSEEEDQYHTADRRQFTFHDDDTDDENAGGRGESSENQRRDWIRRQFARIHVLRALSQVDD